MARDEKIYLAYLSVKSSLSNQGADRVHARALIRVSELFKISPLKVQQIVRERKK